MGIPIYLNNRMDNWADYYGKFIYNCLVKIGWEKGKTGIGRLL